MESTELVKLMEARKLSSSGRARSIRLTAGIKLPEIAEPCDVDQSTISRWERGLSRPRGAAALKYLEIIRELEAATTIDEAQVP